MRHIPSFHQLGDRGFSHPFQWLLIKTSGACRHLVAIETTDLVHGSDLHECGRTYGNSASSDTLEAEKIQRRVSMDERKSMVENYVNRYREMNAGKFPTATDIKKNVGGSYYSVRKILQELIYYSETPLSYTKDSVSSEKSVVEKAKPCADSEKVFLRKKLKNRGPTSKVVIRDDSFKTFDSKDGLQSPISDQSGIAKRNGPQPHRFVSEPKSNLLSDPEINMKRETVHEDKLRLGGFQPESELEQSTESDVSERESHRVPTADAEPPKKSSVWQNLRSFANGFFGIWKRS